MEKDIESKQEKVYDENWDPKIICPICGKYRFNDEYDICPYCHWENDPIQFADPNYVGGANKKSLNEYKKHYKHSFSRIMNCWHKKIKQ